jgi:Fanconi anemia group M protein
MQKPIIKIDKREIRSGIVDYLKNFGCEIQEENLEIGDYLLSERVVIERKSFSDFIASIKDLRLFKQAKELTKFEKPILLIEGFEYLGNLNESSLFGALALLILNYNISTIWTKNKRESANFIFLAAKREQIEEKRGLTIRVRKKPLSLEEEQKYLIAGLPYINSTLAERLLKKFGTPIRVFNAKKEELMEIEKIGEKKANKILEVLKTKSI